MSTRSGPRPSPASSAEPRRPRPPDQGAPMSDIADDLSLEPVVRRVVVHCSADHAWQTFTSDIGTWWPIATHSLEADRVASIRFDAGEGGIVAEVWDDGT